MTTSDTTKWAPWDERFSRLHAVDFRVTDMPTAHIAQLKHEIAALEASEAEPIGTTLHGGLDSNDDEVHSSYDLEKMRRRLLMYVEMTLNDLRKSHSASLEECKVLARGRNDAVLLYNANGTFSTSSTDDRESRHSPTYNCIVECHLTAGS